MFIFVSLTVVTGPGRSMETPIGLHKIKRPNKHLMKKLLITSITAATALLISATASEKHEKKSIVEIAAGNEDFSTLVAAVKAAGLAETLSGEGPFTVFAPTNEAFAKLPDGALDELLKPENKDALADVLTYHVVSGKVMAADVKPMDAETVNGAEAKVTVDGDTVQIDDATVVKTDIEASNGVIHVIDAVIMPAE